MRDWIRRARIHGSEENRQVGMILGLALVACAFLIMGSSYWGAHQTANNVLEIRDWARTEVNKTYALEYPLNATTKLEVELAYTFFVQQGFSFVVLFGVCFFSGLVILAYGYGTFAACYRREFRVRDLIEDLEKRVKKLEGVKS